MSNEGQQSNTEYGSEPDTLSRYRRFLRDSEKAHGRTRRYMWADFLVVLLFIAAAMYFFWPILFSNKEPYAPVSTVNQIYEDMKSLQQALAGVDADNNGDDFITCFEALKAASPRMEGQLKRLYWILIETDGEERMMTQNNELDFWESIPNEILDKKTGFYSHTKEGKGVLIYIEPVPERNLIVVTARKFPPLFETGGV